MIVNFEHSWQALTNVILHLDLINIYYLYDKPLHMYYDKIKSILTSYFQLKLIQFILNYQNLNRKYLKVN